MSGGPVREGIFSGIPDVVYHADRDSLSSSGARLLLSTSPIEFWTAQQEPPNPKPEYDVGHLCHKMVLGEGGKIVRIPFNDWRKQEAKDRRERAWAEGRIPALPKHIDEAQRMAGKVHEHRLARRLLMQGDAELSGWWVDEETGVRLRYRPDFIPLDVGRPMLVEYKTAANANPRKFAKSAADFGYHQQGAWYLDGLAATTGITDAVFVVIVQQKTPPYPVSVCTFEPEDLARGHIQNRRAIRLFAQCRERGEWPGYEGLTVLALPGWVRQMIDDENTLEGEMS